MTEPPLSGAGRGGKAQSTGHRESTRGGRPSASGDRHGSVRNKRTFWPNSSAAWNMTTDRRPRSPDKRRRLDELMSVLKRDRRLVVSGLSRLGRSLGQIVAVLDAPAKAEVERDLISERTPRGPCPGLGPRAGSSAPRKGSLGRLHGSTARRTEIQRFLELGQAEPLQGISAPEGRLRHPAPGAPRARAADLHRYWYKLRRDSDRYKVAKCIQAEPVFCGFGRSAHSKVISVSVLRGGLGRWTTLVADFFHHAAVRSGLRAGNNQCSG